MRRGAKPAKAKVGAQLPTTRKSRKSEGSKVRDLENRLAEALEQQTATSEILRVISRSPGDLQPVLNAVAGNAARLCGASDVIILRTDGDVLRMAASVGNLAAPVGSDLRSDFGFPLTRGSVSGRAVIDRTTLHVQDLAAESDTEFPTGKELQRRFGHRTMLATPLLRDDTAVGVICVFKTEVQPFSDSQIALLQTFANQAVIAIENVRLFNELQEKNRALTQAHAQVTEALDRQTTTSEILRVISSSPTDVRPVFDAIVRGAQRLLGAHSAAAFQLLGDLVHRVAATVGGPGPATLYPMPLDQMMAANPAAGRVWTQAELWHVTDTESDVYLTPAGRSLARSSGYRSLLWVPLVRDHEVVGVIAVTRPGPGGFTDAEIALLRTFADQAVIAIENVRLFTELRASNRELTTALDKQTATSDILRVISRSQTDVQPVFDAIVASAVRLLGAYTGALTQIVGDQLNLVALTSTDAEGDAGLRATFPRSLQSRQGSHEQAIRGRAPLNVADAETDPRLSETAHAYARIRGYRSQIAVPMLRHDEVIGTISVTRREPGGFSDDEIALLQTFADQAVIAIENVRLFRELQERNRELTEALDQQTATSNVLKVISRSTFDLDAVLTTLIENATRLCGAHQGFIFRADGERYHLAADYNASPAFREWAAATPIRPGDGRIVGRVAVEGGVVQIVDAQGDAAWRAGNAGAPGVGDVRALLGVPMLRAGVLIGVFAMWRLEPRPFSDKQIELVTTFADQAVIAIENVRLFKELQARTTELTHSVEQLTALGEVGQAISSTLDLQTVLGTIVARAIQLSGTDAGVIYEYDEQREVFLPRATEYLEAEIVETMLATPVRKGEGATGRLAEVQEPLQLPDILSAPAESRVRGALVRAGYRALLAVPLVREGHLLGGLTVIRKATGEFRPEVIDLMRTFATQSAVAIQNARLFREIEDKSRQLEAASRHKSEFLANMSHELRTPLNAIIGFSEVLAERMFGALNEKQEEYLKDIHASGQHLLSLINDILDLSKIEAGRMELELADFDLPQAISNALTLVRDRAARRGIALHQAVDERLGQIRGDERKIKQVLLNLLSNALKFTPEGGRVDVRASVVDSRAEISVTDTGVGIAPEDQGAVFEEFRQVGTAAKKVEGTGLGLALSRKFIELHGGRIWVESQVGQGSTFTFTLPVRRDE